jgi:hypothetical protein
MDGTLPPPTGWPEYDPSEGQDVPWPPYLFEVAAAADGSWIVEEIIKGIQARIASVVPRRVPGVGFTAVERLDLEDASQPNQARHFNVTWGEDVETLPETGVVTQAEIRGEVVVRVAYSIPQGDRRLLMNMAMLDREDLILALCQPWTTDGEGEQSPAYPEADDGEAYAINALGPVTLRISPKEVRALLTIPLEVFYRVDVREELRT